MQKVCEKCKNIIDCKVNDIANCQCSSANLTKTEIKLINKRYKNCLCLSCLLKVQRS
ncbi:MAG: cysteine-rich CWC family protein [Crocinitomicaceae bacterium]